MLEGHHAKPGVFAQFFDQLKLHAKPLNVIINVLVDGVYGWQIRFYGQKGVSVVDKREGWLFGRSMIGGAVVPQDTWELLDPVLLCSFKALSEPFLNVAIGDFTVGLCMCHQFVEHLDVVRRGLVSHFVALELCSIIYDDSSMASIPLDDVLP